MATLSASQFTALHAKFGLGIRGKMKTRGAAFWKQTSKKLETVGEIGSGPECRAQSCWRPMAHEEMIKALIL